MQVLTLLVRLYLDHAATSPLRPEAVEAMLPFLTDPGLMGNPSSRHYEGRRAAEALDQLRDRAAAVLGCRHDDVTFNSGGTEGCNHALLGLALACERPLHFAVSAVEHRGVLAAAERLQCQSHRVTQIPVDGNALVQLDFVESLLREDRPDLVSVMMVNNEVGTLQPVSEIAALCLAHGTLFHSDAVQAVGHGLQKKLHDPRTALLSITAHKFGGPRGAGLLVQRRRLLAEALGTAGMQGLPGLVCGGGQESRCRAGTENLAGIAGLVTALELAEGAAGLAGAELLEQFQKMFEARLLETWPDCVIHARNAQRSAHITSVAWPALNGQNLQLALDRLGVAVGLGSACAGCSNEPSHVLLAMGAEPAAIRGTLRFSGNANSAAEQARHAGELVARLQQACSSLPDLTHDR